MGVDNYILGLKRAIVHDYIASPYRWFKKYWQDHSKGWLDILDDSAFEKVIVELKKEYDL